MARIALILFFIVGFGEIISQTIDSNYLHWVCKPLIMLTLGIYYFLSSSHRSAIVLLAILFSFVGDVLLMFEVSQPGAFIAGLSAFLVAQMFYIRAYRQHQDASVENSLKGIQKIRLSFPIVLAGTGLLVILYPSLQALKLPVTIYTLVLIIMVLHAVFRYGRTINKSFWLVSGGSLLFMVSDSLLAINKFFQPLNSAGMWIMSSYILAQFFIIEGLRVHVNHARHPKP